MRYLYKLSTVTDTQIITVKLYKDTEYNEYVCRLYYDNVECKDASYHTDIERDASATMQTMLEFAVI
jgi:predicted RNase H-related nuclease YkuK (DUF458 family)